MRLAWVIVLLLGCKDSEPTKQAKSGPGRNIVDDEVKRALVLDGAIEKLNRISWTLHQEVDT